MKKKSILWMSMLLLLLTACSNDDESANTSSSTNPIGYWMSTSENAMGLHGLIFSADGEILSWQYRTNPEPGQDNYVEYHWGYFWLDDTGALDISTRPRDSEPNPDEMYYKIQSLTNDCLVIRSWGGFAGIPLEKGIDTVYHRMPGKFTDTRIPSSYPFPHRSTNMRPISLSATNRYLCDSIGMLL